ncbi:MAG: transglycosylase SLT domain-containing protein [Pseudobdellovibrio sp.]
MAWTKLRNVKKQSYVVASLTFVFLMNQSCQSFTVKAPDLSSELSDKARVQHAQELLKTGYNRSIAKEFEGDKEFSTYLEKYIAQENSSLDSVELSHTLMSLGRDHLYDPVFLLAVIKTESKFNPLALGSHGEIGLMQIKPDTAEWISGKNKFKWKGANALKDPAYNMQVGALYFNYLKKSLNSKSAHYINAYNLGINNLQRLPASGRISHPYYEKVFVNYLAIYQELKKIRKAI